MFAGAWGIFVILVADFRVGLRVDDQSRECPHGVCWPVRVELGK